MLVPYFIPLATIKDLGVLSYWGGVHFFHNYEIWEGQDQGISKLDA